MLDPARRVEEPGTDRRYLGPLGLGDQGFQPAVAAGLDVVVEKEQHLASDRPGRGVVDGGPVEWAGVLDDCHVGPLRQPFEKGEGLGLHRAVVDQHQREVDRPGGGRDRVDAGSEQRRPVPERDDGADGGSPPTCPVTTCQVPANGPVATVADSPRRRSAAVTAPLPARARKASDCRRRW